MGWLTRGRWIAMLASAASVLILPVMSAEAAICWNGSQTVTSIITITESCTVTGNLVVQSGGIVFVNYRASNLNRFRLQGNLVLKGNGQFFLAGGVLEFQQDFRQQREIRTMDSARFVVADAQVVTSQNAAAKYMYHVAQGSSESVFINSSLDPASSWLISQVHGSSTVRVVGSHLVPTEIYIRAESSVSIQSSTGIGCWMELKDQSFGQIDLPVQVDSADRLIPYTFRWGRESASAGGIGWQLDINNSKVNLGVESAPGSSFRINGVGRPLGGELKVAYAITEGTHVFNKLGTGLVNIVMDGGRLILKNVQLGLVSWHMYVRDADVLIKDSILNEVGVDVNARVRIENSVLQLAQLASLSGSVLEIYGSQMYSQGVDIFGSGRVVIQDSAIRGGSFRTFDPLGVLQIINGAFLTNPADCSFETTFQTSGGVPYCNPFIPPGAAPTKSGPGTMTCAGTADCPW